jgi:phytochrome-interacting factor 3
VIGCRSDGNEFAELLWENGQAVVHGRRKQPQPAFQPFGTGSNGVQEKHHGGDNMMAFTKAGNLFGATGMAPSLHDFSSGLHASHENGDEDAVPWIHYPIMEDDESTAPALTTADYCSDFFSELQEAAAAAATANLGSLPPSNPNATNNRGAPVASSSRAAPFKEIHGLSAPGTRTSQPQAPDLAAAKQQPRPSSNAEGVMNFSLFSRPAALARATLQSVQRPQGTDKVSNVTTSNPMESTVFQTTSGQRSDPVFADQRSVWQHPKDVRFSSAAAPVGNLQQMMAREKVSNNTAVHKDAARKAPEATVATSSVCSANGAANEERWHQQKRRIQAECSASQDEVSKTICDAV